MATASNSAAGYVGNTGAGGKFRKKPFRRSQATPYDRPPTALRPAQAAAVAAENNGWLSKLVEPASKLITAGAHKLFSSVFRKRLLPPPSRHRPDDNMEITNMQPQAATVVVPFAAKEPTISGVDDPGRISDSDGIAELEGILKQKTFTRSELDHLTTLLLSRTAGNSTVAEKSSEPKNSDWEAIHCRNENHAYVPAHENVVEHVVPGVISTPAMKSKVLEEEVASPAELAKAYMGSRPRKASPSVLGFQNQMSREHLSAANNPPFTLRSPVTSLLQKPVSDVGTSENGFLTPRYRGKSAIYCMARTPYFRIHPAATFKDAESTVSTHGGSFLSHKTSENDQLNGSKKQVLKRRSSVLENDIGSVGPIRRIRQKPNLLHPKILTLPASVGSRVTNVSGMLSDAAEMPSSSNWNSHSHSFSKSVADNSMPGTSSAYVPSQSIETAQKIFQQLDKFTPKGKSSDLKSDFGGGSSSSKMTRSMETADALKVSLSSGDSKKENAPSDSVARLDPPPKISFTVEDTGLKKVGVPYDSPALESGVEVRTPNSNASHNTKVTNGASRSNFDHHPKMRAFQMSAHEDYLELDDDVHLNGVVSTPLSEGGENTGVSKKSVAILDVPSQNEKPAVPEPNSSANSLLIRKESESLSDGPVMAGNAASFTFPVVPSSSPATSTGVPATVSTHSSALVSDKVVQQNEPNIAVPAFSAKSGKLPSLVFSTTSSGLEYVVQKDSKLEMPNSANDLVSNANGSTENDKKSSHETLEVVEKSEDVPSPFTSAAKGIFSFGLPVNNPTVNNGLPSTVPTSTVSSPLLFSSTFSKQSPPVTTSVPSLPIFTGGSSLSNGFTSSVSTSSTAAPTGTVASVVTTSSMANFSASSGQLPSLVTASSVSSGPIFQFGTSAVSSTSAALASGSSALESAENSGAKSSETAFGSTTTSSLFSTKSSVTSTGGGVGIFGFNASTIKSTSGEGQTAAPAASSGSIFGFQASSSTAPVSTSTPSFPTQFSSLTSSPVFGFSGATNPSSGASVFASNLLGSGSGSASSSLGASCSSVSSSNGTTSNSIFNSNWQPSKPSFPTFGATSPSTGFSFGASASGTSADNNQTSVVFGSTNPSSSAAGNSSPFLFGAAANSSTAPIFSFGGNTITSTPISTPASSSQPAFGNSTSTTIFAFGPTPPGNNNDQMSLEDSMAEDSMQASTPATLVFGQPPAPALAPSSNTFVFGQTPSPGFGGAAAPPSSGSPFQFGSQQNQMAPLSPSPFQPSGSVEFNAGGAGSFSLGTGGDKASRRIVKVKSSRPRKK